jgi:hypothetical protein
MSDIEIKSLIKSEYEKNLENYKELVKYYDKIIYKRYKNQKHLLFYIYYYIFKGSYIYTRYFYKRKVEVKEIKAFLEEIVKEQGLNKKIDIENKELTTYEFNLYYDNLLKMHKSFHKIFSSIPYYNHNDHISNELILYRGIQELHSKSIKKIEMNTYSSWTTKLEQAIYFAGGKTKDSKTVEKPILCIKFPKHIKILPIIELYKYKIGDNNKNKHITLKELSDIINEIVLDEQIVLKVREVEKRNLNDIKLNELKWLRKKEQEIYLILYKCDVLYNPKREYKEFDKIYKKSYIKKLVKV